MNIDLDTARAVLAKWRDERRLIQVGLIASLKSGAHLVGRVARLDEESVRIDASSIDRAGHRTALELSFADIEECRFHDWRDAPPEFADQLRDVVEEYLNLYLSRCHCELYGLKTKQELTSQ
jgi:hypothetical protein